VSLTIGKPFAGGIIGGVAPVAGDYGAVAIDSKSGAPAAGGDVAPPETLGSFGRTVMAAVGVDDATAAAKIHVGKVIRGALAA